VPATESVEAHHLIVDGRPVAPLELATRRRPRTRGLLGRTGLDGALWLSPVRSVHTIGMRFPIDVALCDATGRVLHVIVPLVPGRATWPHRGIRVVVEAGAGAFERWGLHPGTTVAFAGASRDR
jgi:uncharacterized protein